MPYYSSNNIAPKRPKPIQAAPEVKPKEKLDDDLQFMTVTEVAKLLHIGPASVYRLADRGEVPSYKILSKRLFKRKDIMTYIDSCAFPAIKR